MARNYLFAQLIGVNCVTGMSLMFPKELLSMTEFNQLSLHLAEDHYLARLIKEKGMFKKKSVKLIDVGDNIDTKLLSSTFVTCIIRLQNEIVKSPNIPKFI